MPLPFFVSKRFVISPSDIVFSNQQLRYREIKKAKHNVWPLNILSYMIQPTIL